MAKGQMVTVTVLGWEKHNGAKKKGHQYFMLSTRFFDDEKIMSLSSGDKVVYIWLLSRCGDALKSTISFPEVALKSASSNLKVPLKSLELLQELQLLRIDKIEPLKNITRQDKTRHHKTSPTADRKIAGPVEDRPAVPAQSSQPENLTEDQKRKANRQLWDVFIPAYLARYGHKPIRDAAANSIMGKIRSRIGVEDGKKVLLFYLAHKESFYTMKAHSLGICLRDIDSLRIQALNDQQMTSIDARRYDKRQEQQSLLDDLKGRDL